MIIIIGNIGLPEIQETAIYIYYSKPQKQIPSGLQSIIILYSAIIIQLFFVLDCTKLHRLTVQFFP